MGRLNRGAPLAASLAGLTRLEGLGVERGARAAPVKSWLSLVKSWMPPFCPPPPLSRSKKGWGGRLLASSNHKATAPPGLQWSNCF